MRYLPHIAIAGAVVACAAIAYYAFSGKTPAHQTAGISQGYSENSYCRVVSFNERAKNGTAGPCLRCVTGTYTATSWTNCPVRQSSDQPGSVECGYNADQTPTAIDPGTMCAESGNGQAAPAGAGRSEAAGGDIADGGNPTNPAGGTTNNAENATAEPGASQPVQTTAPNNAKANGDPLAALVGRASNAAGGGTVTVVRTANPNVAVTTGGRTTYGGSATTTSGRTNYTSSIGARHLESFAQSETRDYQGRITREAATIHVVVCPGTGYELYIYEYLKRRSFRAIQPPDYGQPLGGRDFPTYDEAVTAGCNS
jgi:hypothetical protein